jgi:hypothetical protein
MHHRESKSKWQPNILLFPYISKCEEQQYHDANFEQDLVNISGQRTISLAYSIRTIPRSSDNYIA